MSQEKFNKLKTAKYLRAKQLAEYLGVSLATVWLWNKQKKITSKKLSERVTVFDVAEVEKALFSGVA